MKIMHKILWGCNAVLMFFYVFCIALCVGASHVWGKVSLTALEQFACPSCLDKIGRVYGAKLVAESFFWTILTVAVVFWLFKKFYKKNECYFPVWGFIAGIIGLEYLVWMFLGRFLSLQMIHLFILCLFVVLCYLINLWRRYEAKYIFGLLILFYPLFLMICIYYQPLLFASYKGSVQVSNPSGFEEQARRNLIVVYAESFNLEFSKVTYEGKDYKTDDEDAVKFAYFKEGVEQDFTKNALTASFSGIIPSYYTKNQRTIGQIIKDKGYQMLFVQGGDIEFSDTFVFLKRAGFEEKNIIALSENKFKDCVGNLSGCQFGEIMKEKDALWWGVGDDVTFGVFEKKINELDKDKPFFAVMFTIDLHEGVNPWQNGFEEAKAKNIVNINNFIEWFRKQDFYENTSLIILADHARAPEGNPEKDYIPLYNAFFNLPEHLTKNLDTNRTFNQTDMFLTMLEIMGFKLPKGQMGYSTTLFSSKKTIAERFTNEQMIDGQEKINLLCLLGKSKQMTKIIGRAFGVLVKNLW